VVKAARSLLSRHSTKPSALAAVLPPKAITPRGNEPISRAMSSFCVSSLVPPTTLLHAPLVEPKPPKLELITPFKHLDPTNIVLQASYDTPLVLLDVVVILVSIGVSYWLYNRRDVPAVS
jgi:hypothetical protein